MNSPKAVHNNLNHLKVLFTLKICHYLLTIMSFQICMQKIFCQWPNGFG